MSESKPITGESTNPPPKYTEDPESAEPPKEEHHSFWDRLKHARHDSKGPCHFLLKFFEILVDTIGFLIFIGLLLALPISMIVVGALNLNYCPIERFIPIWLLVSGAILAFMQLVFIIKKVRDRFEIAKHPYEEHMDKPYGCFNGLLTLFNIAWFIAGNVWVFGVFAPNVEEASSLRYCDNGVYYYSFWLIIVAYIWMLFTCCCSGCVAIAGVREVAAQVTGTSKKEEEEAGSSEPAKPAEQAEEK